MPKCEIISWSGRAQAEDGLSPSHGPGATARGWHRSLTDASRRPHEAEDLLGDTQAGQNGTKIQILVCLWQGPKALTTSLPPFPTVRQLPRSVAISRRPERYTVSVPCPKTIYCQLGPSYPSSVILTSCTGMSEFSASSLDLV